MESAKLEREDKKILTRVYILPNGDLLVTDMWGEFSVLESGQQCELAQGAEQHGQRKDL